MYESVRLFEFEFLVVSNIGAQTKISEEKQFLSGFGISQYARQLIFEFFYFFFFVFYPILIE